MKEVISSEGSSDPGPWQRVHDQQVRELAVETLAVERPKVKDQSPRMYLKYCARKNGCRIPILRGKLRAGSLRSWPLMSLPPDAIRPAQISAGFHRVTNPRVI